MATLIKPDKSSSFVLEVLLEMSAPVKKRATRIDSDTNSSSNDECSEIYKGQEEIQVDFEGRNPIDSDFHGIKQLLQQLFLKAHVNLSDLTDLIISQNFVGSVVKQSETDEDSGDEEDSDINEVFGVTSVVNLTDKQNLECVDQLRTLLKELCLEHGSDQSNTLVRSLLADDTHSLGLLINERFVNIPAMIAVPLLESLSKEMKRAKEKKLPFDFSHYVIICKLYKLDEKKNKKRGKGNRPANQEPGVIWSNPEEEIIDQMADAKFEFCIKGETDSGLSGQWMEDDAPMTPYRRVLLLSAEKLDPVIEHIKDVVRK